MANFAGTCTSDNKGLLLHLIWGLNDGVKCQTPANRRRDFLLVVILQL